MYRKKDFQGPVMWIVLSCRKFQWFVQERRYKNTISHKMSIGVHFLPNVFMR